VKPIERRTGIGIELGLVQVFHNLLDLLDIAIPLTAGQPTIVFCTATHSLSGDIHLEVSADEELARHDCGSILELVIRD
jgi:23S rRNA G2069 N7-methylase RlmK/C1962 C5-methylase RlmI